MRIGNLYDFDFLEWTLKNAELLREGRFAEADILHIAEEIEDMAGNQRRELRSRLRVLATHLLKWKYQPGLRGPSWRRTIRTQRAEIADLVRFAPSLGREAGANLLEVYRRAAADAVDDTGLPRSHFPPECPFSLEQVLDEEFFPE